MSQSASIDADLARLSDLALERRLSLLQRLMEYWHGPLLPGGGLAARDLLSSIPLPLRRFYEWGGWRTEMEQQNRFVPPDRLTQDEDGFTTFYVENQDVYLWAVKEMGTDPEVYGQFKGDEPWTAEDVRLSEFLIQALLFEVVMGAPYGASASWETEDVVDRIAAHVPPLKAGTWRWPSSPTRFYGKSGACAVTCPNGEADGVLGYSIWIGAKTGEPLAFLHDIAGEAWEYKSF